MTSERAILWPTLVAVGGLCWVAGLLAGVFVRDADAEGVFVVAAVAGLVAIVGGCLRLALNR